MNFNLPEEFRKAKDLIQKGQRFLIVCHRRPDGDTLGAGVALGIALENMGKFYVLACIDEVPQRLRFIPNTDRFVREFNMDEFDAIAICDAGASHMTGFQEQYPDFLSKRVPIINIDHHASNEGFGTINIVDPKSSSASMLVWDLSKVLGVTPTPEMAFAVMAGIYNDTGGMMHANTSQQTFAMAAELMHYGKFNIRNIVQPLFRDFTVGQLKLWGHILEHLNKNDEGVVSAVVTSEDVERLKVQSGDTGGIVDFMNTVPNSKFTMLITEDEPFVKGSLRTQRDDVNVSDIAGQFGGGGHAKASGFRVHGRLEKNIVWKIVPTENQKK